MKKYLLFIALSAGPPAAYTQAGNLDGTYSAAALSVFVSDSDVYVAGQESNGSGTTIAKIWKNGVATNLSNSSSAGVYSVFVK